MKFVNSKLPNVTLIRHSMCKVFRNQMAMQEDEWESNTHTLRALSSHLSMTHHYSNEETHWYSISTTYVETDAL